jgi:hypothetical protein
MVVTSGQTLANGVFISSAVDAQPYTFVVIQSPFSGACPLAVAEFDRSQLPGEFRERDFVFMSKLQERSRATSLVKLAVQSGKLTRPDQCQICTKKPIDHKTRSIVAHHWNGYDDPLNVWWCCRSCNGILDVHDGSLSLEQAKLYVRKRQRAKLGYYDDVGVVTHSH